MDTSREIARQMSEMGRLGPPFATALQRAQRREGMSKDFVRDGVSLLRQLSGEEGAGAPDCLRDAPQDLITTQAFLAKWDKFRDVSGYKDVLQEAKRLAQALAKFNDTIRNLRSSQRQALQVTAAAGHSIDRVLRGKTLVPTSIVAVLIGVVSVLYITASPRLAVLPLIPLAVALTWWREMSLYGLRLPHALRATTAAAWRSGAKTKLIGGLVVLLTPFVAPQLIFLSSIEMFFSMVVAATTFSWVFRPPAVVLLASSDGGESARELVRDVSRGATRGLRVMYFLREEAIPVEDAALKVEQYFQDTLGNLHVKDDRQWEDVVFPLIDVAPVVLVDARHLSPALLHELDRINGSPSLAAKAFVLPGSFSIGLQRRLPRLSTRIVQEDEVLERVATAVTEAMHSYGTTDAS